MSLLNTLIPSFTRASSRLENETTAPRTAIKPRYEVKETTDAYALTVYLPGVGKDGLELTAQDGEIRVAGRQAWKQPEGWTSLYRESADASFELVLTHENAINADQIAAELVDGVLKVTLPKSEAVKPRKIPVN